ncbi:MAG: hypothetical protein ACD_57C00325G0003 [uncultured bacterium]|nr:MAG: hypothetical protein ACD_57C00325G0003 [uncultured bacterium]
MIFVVNSKKITTNNDSIDQAESKLNINYPKEIREMLKNKNGFYFGGFRFYKVLDKEDLQHTFDDVVRENTNSPAGWQQFLPEGYVAIADDEGQGCLALNTNKDGKVYYWNNDIGEITIYAENGQDFETKIKEDGSNLRKL